ncbi:MAG TPA: carboxypeptidase regulatory-like domain-containing protein [Vicinamibacterales bacterium]|nr:carboxypeptidase regulatory-like domain-containing protein [Vicinamibacterales bacterium]
MPGLAVLLTVGLALVLAGGRPASGTIRGRVDVRVERSLRDARPDPGGLGMGQARDPAERRSSVVYLETAPRAAFEPGEDRRARLNQRDERFVPHVLAVAAGTWVDFPNTDMTYHNVFSLSKGHEFNLGRYASGRSRAWRFDRPGIVRVFCEIHSHMSAFILVFAHRYFAVTDDDGRYRIEGVPPGTYTLAVWNETLSGEPPRRQVAIGESGGDVSADFTLR